MKEKENLPQYMYPIVYALLMGTIFNFIGMALLTLKWGGVDYLEYMFGNERPGAVWFVGGIIVGLLLFLLKKQKG